MAATFVVGEKFSSYQALCDKIQQYQNANNVQLYKRSSRTIEAAQKRCPKKSFNMELKFSELTYSCIHGGKTFKSEGTGKRNQSTFRMGCNAEVRLFATTDGQHLEIRHVNDQHNHEQNESVFRSLFHQRRLASNDKENVENLISVKANNKMIQQKLMTETGKCVLLKDIHNVRTKLKSSKSDGVTTVQSAVQHLSKCSGAYVKLVTNENNELRGLFFQDGRMREAFAAYPEFICIDATYKVNDLRMPLYILLIENGNGHSEIVGIWLVADETEDMITQMLQLFKEQNPSWDKIKTVMSDKDFVEREVFKKEIPNANLKICLFHVLKTFRREMTMEKLGTNKQQRDSILDILQEIAYSSSLEQYERNKKLLMDTQNSHAIDYFLQSWDPIKEQWVTGLTNSCSLGNRTNNRVESINQKIKQVVDKNAKFDDFAHDIVVFLNNHRTEIEGKMCKVTAKVPVVSTADAPVESEYRKELTGYAFTLVASQLKRHENVTIEHTGDGEHKVKDTDLVVSESTCVCLFHTQYQLPCKHIFALRKTLDKGLFDKSLFSERWSKQYYLGAFRNYQRENQLSRSVFSPRNRVQSQQQRYRTVYHVAQKLSACAAEQTGPMFEIRLKQLNTLLQAWERGDDVIIQPVASQEENLPTHADLPLNVATSDPEEITNLPDSDVATSDPAVAINPPNPTELPAVVATSDPASEPAVAIDLTNPEDFPTIVATSDQAEAINYPNTGELSTIVATSDPAVTVNLPDDDELPTAVSTSDPTVVKDKPNPADLPTVVATSDSAEAINLPNIDQPATVVSTSDPEDITNLHALDELPSNVATSDPAVATNIPAPDVLLNAVAATDTTVVTDISDPAKLQSGVATPDPRETKILSFPADLPTVVATTNPDENSHLPAQADLSTVVPTTENCILSSTVEVKDIVLPPIIRKRGRPKGSELTVIGIPKKRLKLKKRPTPFQHLKTDEKDKIMLKWFVTDEVIDQCLLANVLITADSVENNHELINMAATETSLETIEKYFQRDAWSVVLNVVERARKRSITCFVCDGELETRCVSCDLCLSWFHYHCAAVSETPKIKFWFCRECYL